MADWLAGRYSPFDTMVESEGEKQRLWLKELRDVARGFCGALFVALPLHYTEEMWQHARTVPALWLLLALVAAYVANVGFIFFEGFKPEPERGTAWLDALTALGIGVVASSATLLLTARLDAHMPPLLMARLILLETTITSFGASLAINQLGSRSGYQRGTQPADDFPTDLRKVLATLLGALLFSFNIAPTVEPGLIAASLSWAHLLGIILFSLFVSALMIYFADFVERDDKGGVLGGMWAETGLSYLLSLAVSALLLLFFGYLGPGTSLPVAVAHIVVLGYVTTLGGSAGRLVI